jgi:hypothetical protein
LALAHLEFWRKHKIFSEQGIARMLEIELTSDLLIAGQEGMQDKKKTIDTFYEKWELSHPNQVKEDYQFKTTMSTIAEVFSDDSLAASDFKRAPLFYTLYCVVYHHLFGLPGIQWATLRRHLNKDQYDELKNAVILLSEKIDSAKDSALPVPRKYKAFIDACQRQTDNIAPRKIRFDSLYDESF